MWKCVWGVGKCAWGGGRSVEKVLGWGQWVLGWGWEKGRWGCGEVWEERWCHDLGPRPQLLSIQPPDLPLSTQTPRPQPPRLLPP